MRRRFPSGARVYRVWGFAFPNIQFAHFQSSALLSSIGTIIFIWGRDNFRHRRNLYEVGVSACPLSPSRHAPVLWQGVNPAPWSPAPGWHFPRSLSQRGRIKRDCWGTSGCYIKGSRWTLRRCSEHSSGSHTRTWVCKLAPVYSTLGILHWETGSPEHPNLEPAFP